MKIIISPGPTFLENPFFGLFNAEMVALGNTLTAPRLRHLFCADVFHVHFPEHKVSVIKNLISALINATAMLVFMLIIKVRGKPIIWMVHDVLPLRRYHPRLCSVYTALVRKMVTGYIFLSQSSRQEFERLYPEERTKPIINVLHPPYYVNFLSSEKKTALRQQLGIEPDEFAIGYLGDIKSYKNPDILCQVPERLDDGRAIALLIAGRPDSEATAFEKDIANRRHIRIPHRLSDEELETYIQAVDIVFLPYAWGWNSGFLFLVLSCHQKCLTSNLPIFREMKADFGNHWITIFDLDVADKKSEIEKAVNVASKMKCDATTRDQLTEQMKEASYPRMAKQIEAFYVSLGAPRNIMQSISTK